MTRLSRDERERLREKMDAYKRWEEEIAFAVKGDDIDYEVIDSANAKLEEELAVIKAPKDTLEEAAWFESLRFKK